MFNNGSYEFGDYQKPWDISLTNAKNIWNVTFRCRQTPLGRAGVPRRQRASLSSAVLCSRFWSDCWVNPMCQALCPMLLRSQLLCGGRVCVLFASCLHYTLLHPPPLEQSLAGFGASSVITVQVLNEWVNTWMDNRCVGLWTPLNWSGSLLAIRQLIKWEVEVKNLRLTKLPLEHNCAKKKITYWWKNKMFFFFKCV